MYFEIRWQLELPNFICPMLTTKKKIVKLEKLPFQKQKHEKKIFRDVVDRCHFPKFGVNSFDGFREKGFDGLTGHGHLWLCCAVAQSRAKVILDSRKRIFL